MQLCGEQVEPSRPGSGVAGKGSRSRGSPGLWVHLAGLASWLRPHLLGLSVLSRKAGRQSLPQ